MECTPDSRYLFTGSFSSLKQWDCQTGALVKDYGSIHNTYIQCMAVTHDGKWLYSGAKSGNVKRIDIENQTVENIRLDFPTPNRIPCMVVTKDDQWLIMACGRDIVKISIRDSKNYTIYDTTHKMAVQCIAVTHDGENL